MNRLVALLAITLSAPLCAAEPASHGKDPHTSMRPAAMAANLTQEGTVLSSLDHAPYTYIEVSQNKKTLWLATMKVAVRQGDRIRFDEGMLMTDFYSKGLKRNFSSIAFVNQVVVSNGRK